MYIGLARTEATHIKNVKEVTVFVDEEGLKLLEKCVEYCKAHNAMVDSKKELLTLIDGDVE